MPHYLFVYGTLQPELAPPQIRPVVARLIREAPAWVRGALYDLGPYPGLVLTDRVGVVRGSVWRLPEDSRVLAQLDRYEGYDPADERRSLFLRRKQLVHLDDGRPVECWLYLYNRRPGRAARVTTGDYLTHLQCPSQGKPFDAGGVSPGERAFARATLRAMKLLRRPSDATRWSQRSIRRIGELAGVPEEDFQRRTTVRRVLGLEESARHWSMAEVAEHLIIVNRRVAKVVAALGGAVLSPPTPPEGAVGAVLSTGGAGPGPVWSILEESPRGRPAAELRRELDGLQDELARAERGVSDWRSPARSPHPGLGPLDVRNWWALNAIHNHIHQRQVERIRRTVSGSGSVPAVDRSAGAS